MYYIIFLFPRYKPNPRGGRGGGGARGGHGGPYNGSFNTRQFSFKPMKNPNKPLKTTQNMTPLDVKWDMSALQPFRRDFYVPHKAVANRQPFEVDEFRRLKNITVSGDHTIPGPIKFFDECNFPPFIMDNLKRQGWKCFTWIILYTIRNGIIK